MKTLDINATTAQTSGVQEQAQLKIEANGKAFKELIGGIYSNKYLAITREIFANAYDAHVVNGNPDEQFVVHVPAKFEPYFSVRDYGVSMDHDMVMDLYSTLFRSTKDDPNNDDSNNYVGKFGLGSKTPFAYTDSFQLTTYKDGTARIYDVFFNGGVPQIALFATEETDERNGVLVQFSVNQDDMDDFYEATIRAAEPFEVRPLFEGREVSIPAREIVMEGSNWRVFKEKRGNGGAEIKMGTVVYPLDGSALSKFKECRDILSIIRDLNLQIDMQIGDVEVSTSRESLSYDQRTIENIVATLELVIPELRAMLFDAIESAPTYWKAACAYQDLRGQVSDSLLTEIVGTNPSWRGRKLQSSINLRWNDKNGYDPGAKKMNGLRKLKASVFRKSDFYYGSPTPRFRGDKRKRYDRYDASVTVDSRTKFFVIIEDTSEKKRYATGRMIEYFDASNQEYRNTDLNDYYVFWVRADLGGVQTTPTAVKRLFAKLGRPDRFDVVHMMNIPYTPPVGAKGGGTRDRFKVLDTIDDEWVSPSEDDDYEGTEAFYVLLDGKTVEVDGRYIQAFTVEQAHSLANDLRKEAGLDALPLVGLNKQQRKRIKENPEWRDLLGELAEALESTVDEASFQKFKLYRAMREITSDLSQVLSIMIEDGGSFGEFDKLIEVYPSDHDRPATDITANYRLWEAITGYDRRSIINEEAVDTRVDVISGSLRHLVKRLQKDFPLIAPYIRSGYSQYDVTEEAKEDIINYVKAKVLSKSN